MSFLTGATANDDGTLRFLDRGLSLEIRHSLARSRNVPQPKTSCNERGGSEDRTRGIIRRVDGDVGESGRIADARRSVIRNSRFVNDKDQTDFPGAEMISTVDRQRTNRPVGRPLGPTKMTPERVEAICQHLEAGHFIDAAARLVDLSPAAFYRWMQKGKRAKDGPYFEFRRVVKKALAVAEDRCLTGLMEAGKDWTRFAWLLERRFPKRWGGHRLMIGPRKQEKPHYAHDDVGLMEEIQRVLGGEQQWPGSQW